MSGVYEPIAGLTPDNQGSINTIVAIILCSTTILFFTIRYAIGRQRLLHLDTDDIFFMIALIFGLSMSIVSQQSVKEGLGQHQNALPADQVVRFFKMRYASQILGVVASACAKLSLVLMFRRIVPDSLAPSTLRVLAPIIVVYFITCIFLVSFQCSPPAPWILQPAQCSTHGRVYYATTAFNMVTDLLLAVWFLPTIWALQMDNNTKLLVMTMFGSRLAVCLADAGRMYVIKRALASEDQTWTNLLWAVLDQVVIHLSLNHATLPRVHVFLSHLQTGFLVTKITNQTSQSGSKGSRRSRGLHDSLNASAQRKGWRSRMMRSYQAEKKKEGSISESPLRLQFDQDVELSTNIYSDQHGQPHAKSTAGPTVVMPREGFSRTESEKQSRSSSSAANSHPVQETNTPMHINVQKTVERKASLKNSLRSPNTPPQ